MPATTKNHPPGSAGESTLDIEAIEILVGFRPGSRREKEELETLKKRLGDRLSREIVVALIHKDIADAGEAREIVNGIIRHKQRLEKLMGRDVGLQITALDYARNIHTLLDNPAITEKEKIAELSRLALHDTEARAYDKGTLLNDIKKEVERTKRYGQTFAVLFIDVDNLKDINETYGRGAGDMALRQAASILKNNMRAVDYVYRFGGDEFVLLLPNADINVAHRVAEKLLHKVRKTTITYDVVRGIMFSITVSIGVETFDDQTVRNVEDVLYTVNALLSQAKSSGKDRIEMPERVELKRRLPIPPETTTVPVRKNERFVMRGTPISRGIAIGRAYRYEDIFNDIAYYEIEEVQIEIELERMRNAIAHVRKDIERMEKQVRLNIGKEYADIFAVHRAILNDMALIGELEEKLKSEKRNAEHIVRTVFKHVESQLVSAENQVMRERSLDIADLGRHLLRYLYGLNRNIFSRLPKNSVVVTKRLLPSESVHLRRDNVAGIITEKGSRNAHAAILARGLGIPYVSETDFPIEKIPHGAHLVVDADRGEIMINPTAEDREAIRSTIEMQKQETRTLIAKFRDAELKKGDRRIYVMANVGTKNTLTEAAAFGCDGIGLYRIEQVYMQNQVFPTQEQLFRTLDDMFAAVKDKEIVVRLLDIGGDKTLPYFDMKDDTYSVLGIRGVRLLLRYPRILETQLTVLLKLSRRYRISVLIPMVTLTEEIIAVRHALEKCKHQLERHDISFNPFIKLGSMIEVPAAVIGIEEILAHSDFVSIGTNDLIQYTMASARENAALTHYYEAGIKTVLGSIERTLNESRKKNIPCSLCGELAADTNFTRQLLDMGLEIFSVSPAGILNLKSEIAELLGQQFAAHQ
jgi:phosphotransferase system enzyme I (PtsI)